MPTSMRIMTDGQRRAGREGEVGERGDAEAEADRRAGEDRRDHERGRRRSSGSSAPMACHVSSNARSSPATTATTKARSEEPRGLKSPEPGDLDERHRPESPGAWRPRARNRKSRAPGSACRTGRSVYLVASVVRYGEEQEAGRGGANASTQGCTAIGSIGTAAVSRMCSNRRSASTAPAHGQPDEQDGGDLVRPDGRIVQDVACEHAPAPGCRSPPTRGSRPGRRRRRRRCRAPPSCRRERRVRPPAQRFRRDPVRGRHGRTGPLASAERPGNAFATHPRACPRTWRANPCSSSSW